MKKTEGNRMTVDQENRIIRQCNHVKGKSTSEIAKELQCGVNTVWRRLGMKA